MAEKRKRPPRKVWEVADYGNLYIAQQQYRLKNHNKGGGGGTSDSTTTAQSGFKAPDIPATLPTGVTTKGGPGTGQPITPTEEVVARASSYLADPGAAVAAAEPEGDTGVIDKAKTILGSLFNTEDSFGVSGNGGDNVVESVWDGFLTGVGWTYDKISQTTVAGLSGLPGGSRTLTWDEAGDVSVGQIGAYNASLGADALREGNPLMGALGLLGGGALNVSLALTQPESKNPMLQDKFDITKEASRRVAFEEDTAWKWSTGLTDAVFTVFADPLIVGGKALKIARLKYVDVPLNTPQAKAKFAEAVDASVADYAAGTTDRLHPAVQFAMDAVTPGKRGKRQSELQILKRAEVVDSADAAGLAHALRVIPDNDVATAALVIKAHAGIPEAAAELAQRNIVAADELVRAKREIMRSQFALNPTRYARAQTKLQAKIDQSWKNLQQGEKAMAEGRLSPEAYNRLRNEFDDAVDAGLDVENAMFGDPLSKLDAKDLSKQQQEIVAHAKKNADVAAALDDLTGFGSMSQATVQFSSNTALGRAVGKSRARRAEAKYEAAMTNKSGWGHKDYFGNGLGTRAVRVWRWFGRETPAYYAATNGTGAVNSHREVEALLNSLKMYSGDSKQVGKAMVGGVAAKEALYEVYSAARSNSHDASAALKAVEERIRDDMIKFYGVDQAVAEHVINKMFRSREGIADQINRTGGFFTKDGTVGAPDKLEMAPYLESQLAQGHYFLPWDKVEGAFDNYMTGKITDPMASGVLTPGQVTKEKLIQANQIFQDFWRPAVLFRLGYTQRNVTEGEFRAMAFLNSVAPIGWVGSAAWKGARNLRREQRFAKQYDEAAALIREDVPGRGKFDSLMGKQLSLADKRRVLMGLKPDLDNVVAQRQAYLAAMKGRGARQWREQQPGVYAGVGAERIVQKVEPSGLDGAWRKDGDTYAFTPTSGNVTYRVTRINAKKWEYIPPGSPIDEAPQVFKSLKEAKAAIEPNLPTKGGGAVTYEAYDDTRALMGSYSNRAEAQAAFETGEMAPFIPQFTMNASGKMATSTDGSFRINGTTKGWQIREAIEEADGRVSYKNIGPLWTTYDEAEQAIQQRAVDAVVGGKDVSDSGQLTALRGEWAKKSEEARSTFEDGYGKKHSTIESYDAEMARLEAELKTVEDELAAFPERPVNPKLKDSKFGKWIEKQVDALDAQIDEGKAWIAEFTAKATENGGALTHTQQANLLWMRDLHTRLDLQRRMLTMNDEYALAEYRSQAVSKRIANSGSPVEFAPGVLINDAFSNERYRNIATMNASADNTIKATLAMRMNMEESLYLSKRMEQYIDVKPGDPKYWSGLEQMLQQFSQSQVGKRLANGDNRADIAVWLMENPAGKDIVRQLNAAWHAANTSKSLREGRVAGIAPEDALASEIPQRINPTDMNSVLEYVDEVAGALNMLTKSEPELLKIVATRPPTAEELKNLLGARTDLIPVVGHTSWVTGSLSAMNMWRRLTSEGFRIIGTMPEDAFVRLPFYAARYRAQRDDMIAALKAAYPDTSQVPLKMVEQIEINSHRRALKDTKDWIYTIDRRTNLGKYGEGFLPFISASQNSLTALGKLTRKDPSLPGIMIALWRAPTQVGWEDEDGNLIIPLPSDLIPDGVEDVLGIGGMSNISINKSSLNVIFPETGFAFAPRPTPLVQVAASELMKKGLLIGVEAPAIMVSMMGAENADALWNGWKDYMFGEEAALSPELLSWDKLTPPVLNRFTQLIQGDASSQYAYQYGIQARTQQLLWHAGEREDPPTPDEIADRTNGQFLLRMMGNLFAFTPPDYQSPIQPLVDLQKRYDKAYGLDGPRMFSDMFGNEMLTISNTESTRNVGGATASANTVRNIKKYGSLIGEIAPTLGADLGVLGILVADDPASAIYDQDAYRWQLATKIPGTSRTWREMNSGGESVAEAQRQAGWTEWAKFEGQLDAILQGRGLPSYRVKGARDLVDQRKAFLDNMLDNPEYAGWAIDWQTTGSSRTYSAINVVKTALANEEFMSDKVDDPTWQSAAIYLKSRDEVIRLAKESGHTLEHKDNEGLADWWAAQRQELIKNSPGWAAIANRYLQGDDSPDRVGATFARSGEEDG